MITTFDSQGIPNLRLSPEGMEIYPDLEILNRHLQLAGIRNPIRLQIAYNPAEVESTDFEEALKDPNFGVKHKVMCPQCEVSLDEDEECSICGGNGLVARKQYVAWLEGYKNACSHKCPTCKREVCVSPDPIGEVMWPVLLVAEKQSRGWIDLGDSLDGWELDKAIGIKNLPAFARYLHEVCVWNDIALDGEDDED